MAPNNCENLDLMERELATVQFSTFQQMSKETIWRIRQEENRSLSIFRISSFFNPSVYRLNMKQATILTKDKEKQGFKFESKNKRSGNEKVVNS